MIEKSGTEVGSGDGFAAIRLLQDLSSAIRVFGEHLRDISHGFN